LVILWQVLSLLDRAESVPGEPMVPGWQILATKTFVSLADYWQGGLGVSGVAQGGQRTYASAALAILSNSIDTGERLFAGLALGALIGFTAGLAVSWSKWTRRLVALPGQVLRTFPLLALIPLFQLWFGLTFLGMMLFVAYGVAVIFFTGTVNAVRNIHPIYVDYARTLRATRLRVYRTVILPADTIGL
jgi:sulfonate transport system permease protein